MKRAVFLDRDGVLNQRHWKLVRSVDQLVILPGVASAVARITRAGYSAFIATNQEWVGMGYIAREDHDAIMARIVEACEAEGGRIDGVYACLHPRGSGCHDRKPKPGMLLDAARDHDLDLSASWMVGDNAKDMLAGRRAGCRTALVDPRLRTWWQRAARDADVVARDLPAAVDRILSEGTAGASGAKGA